VSTRAAQSYTKPVTAAIAEGATTPDPGTVGAVALSDTTGAFMRWTGTAWTAIGGSGGGGGNSVQATVDFGYPDGGEQTLTRATVAAPWVTAASVLVATAAAVATADHDPEDAAVEGILAYPTDIVDGVGFDLIAHAPNHSWGRYLVNVRG
jgi:hypothetical protein